MGEADKPTQRSYRWREPDLLAWAEQAANGDAEAVERISERACALFNADRFGAHLGIVAERATPDLVCGVLPWRLELTRGGGIFHGGAVMGLFDHLAGLIIMSDPRNLLGHRTGLTTDFNVSLLRAVRKGEALRAEIKPLRRGRNLLFLEGSAFGAESGRLVAKARMTYFVVDARSVGKRG